MVSVLDDLSDVPAPSKSVTPQSEIREATFIASASGAAVSFETM